MERLIGPGREDEEDDDYEDDDDEDALADFRETVHVVPLFGRTHVASYDCWCHPEPDTDGFDAPIWVHRTFH